MATYKEIRDIVYGKLIDRTLDTDYEDLSEILFGEGNCFNSSEVRKRLYGARTVIEAIEREGIDQICDEDKLSLIEEREIELRKERQKLTDQRTAFNKLIRTRAREEELNEILIGAVRNGELPSLNYERQYIEASDNDLLISLNDIHYGAVVDNYWNKYNSDICRVMFAKYLDSILEIAERHHSENCIVWQNGDAINGNIHYSIAVSNKENIVEQITGVSELISEFLAELSRHFKTVTYVSVAGNHSRINPDKKMDIPAERLDNLIEWYLEARLHDIDNIKIGGGTKIDDTIFLVDIRGKTYAGVHGDFDPTPTSVQSIQTMAGVPLYAVLSGHLHHSKTDEVQGVKTIMSGSFLGMDDFCVKRRIVGKPEQMVSVCTKDGVLCNYPVSL